MLLRSEKTDVMMMMMMMMTMMASCVDAKQVLNSERKPTGDTVNSFV